ncbi:transposable element Tc1 transposase [Trichonephila clavipes]|nr:transposable element Tc1 transposase [Trichonephila clavipes]
MRICHHWIQKETTDRESRLHPPCCTSAHGDRRTVRMAVMDPAATSRTIAQQIQSFTYPSVSTRTIRRRLQQSGMSLSRPLLRLLLTGNHRRLRRQWFESPWHGRHLKWHLIFPIPVSISFKVIFV